MEIRVWHEHEAELTWGVVEEEVEPLQIALLQLTIEELGAQAADEPREEGHPAEG